MYRLPIRTRIASMAALGAVMTIAFTGIASAGECPPDKMMEGAVTSGPAAPVGVTDTVIASVDLTPKGGDFTGQLLRMRKLVIAPGGIVPWHEHSQRPANIYVISGAIEEHRSNCTVAIIHKTGDVVAEFGASLAHWWQNNGTETVVLISADILPPKKADPNVM